MLSAEIQLIFTNQIAKYNTIRSLPPLTLPIGRYTLYSQVRGVKGFFCFFFFVYNLKLEDTLNEMPVGVYV